MGNSFEEEIQEVLSGFNRKPDSSNWLKIKQKLTIKKLGAIVNPFLIIMITLFIVIVTGWILQQKIGEAPHPEKRHIFIISTSYAYEGDEIIAVTTDTVYLDDELYQKGQKLFDRHCAPCHSVELDKKSTGPSLSGITTKRDRKWLYEFTQNSQKMIVEKDSIALELWNEWAFSVMPPFQNLSKEELQAIYDYIQAETYVEKN